MLKKQNLERKYSKLLIGISSVNFCKVLLHTIQSFQSTETVEKYFLDIYYVILTRKLVMKLHKERFI